MSKLSEVNTPLTGEPEPDESVLSQLDVWSAFRSLASCDANIGTPRQRRSLQAFLQITDIAKEWMKLQSDYPSGSLGLEATEHLSRILIVLGTECRRLQSGELDGKTNGSTDLDSKCEDPRSRQQDSKSACELSPAEEECVRELYMAQSALAGKKLAMSFQNSDGLRDFRQRVKDLERRIGTLESFLHRRGSCRADEGQNHPVRWRNVRVSGTTRHSPRLVKGLDRCYFVSSTGALLGRRVPQDRSPGTIRSSVGRRDALYACEEDLRHLSDCQREVPFEAWLRVQDLLQAYGGGRVRSPLVHLPPSPVECDPGRPCGPGVILRKETIMVASTLSMCYFALPSSQSLLDVSHGFPYDLAFTPSHLS